MTTPQFFRSQYGHFDLWQGNKKGKKSYLSLIMELPLTI